MEELFKESFPIDDLIKECENIYNSINNIPKNDDNDVEINANNDNNDIALLKQENENLQKRYNELLEKIMGKNPDLSFIAAHILSQPTTQVLKCNETTPTTQSKQKSPIETPRTLSSSIDHFSPATENKKLTYSPQMENPIGYGNDRMGESLQITYTPPPEGSRYNSTENRSIIKNIIRKSFC